MDNNIINDEIILQKCLKSNGKVNPNSFKDALITTYLKNRYNDIPENMFNYSEVVQRIHYNIDIRPICEICGNPVKYLNRLPNLYSKYCCKNCVHIASKNTMKNIWLNRSDEDINKIQENSKKTCLLKYGTEYSFQSDNNKMKSDITREIKYGDKNYGKYGSKEFKHKMKVKYGTEYAQSNELIRAKISKALSSVEIQNKIKETNLKKYGVEYVSQSDEIKEKIQKTYKKHSSYKTSLQENIIYELLSVYYSDLIHFYKSDIYPYNCDLYIPTLDLYIECNFHISHYIHHYDEYKDTETLHQLQDKNYNDIIKIWTIKDPQKYNTAQNNKLNYLVIYEYFHKDWRKLCYFTKNIEEITKLKNIISNMLYTFIEEHYRNKKNIQLRIGEKYE